MVGLGFQPAQMNLHVFVICICYVYINIYYILNYILYINRQWAGPDWVRLRQALAWPSRFQAFQNWAQPYPVALGQE